MLNKPPLVFMILDGFGYATHKTHNAIHAANTPQWDAWWATCPHTLLSASGESVGLPSTQMGNSEVGHMHIGAGRAVPQDLTRINHAIESGEFATHPILKNTCAHLKSSQTLHVMGLLSEGGVHSHEAHLFAFLTHYKNQPVNIALHLFLDGRDTPPQSALSSIQKLQQCITTASNISIASISGRYYALDRDNRWERTQTVYDLLTQGKTEHAFDTPEAAINTYYEKNIFDEFIPPTQIGPAKPIASDDAVFFFNFRADRARQLTTALTAETFDAFPRAQHPTLRAFISMTSYATRLKTEVLFPAQYLQNTLGEVLSKHHLRQLRVAETEKYAHVTFFLNGGIEAAFPGEDRVLIPSPNVKTYDLKPEMSAKAVTQAIVDAIHHKTHDVIICNYANADMVGHTGNFEATCKAIEALDEAMRCIGNALQAVNGELLITADHGNAEAMFNTKTSQAHTAHTTNPVPLLYVGDKAWQFKPNLSGCLIDIAPTILALLDITPPSNMTGQSLLMRDKT